MGRQSSITLVLGGARSGKTAWAEAEAMDLAGGDLAGGGAPSKPVYLATGLAVDAEMEARIERHRRSRAGRFTTVEAPVDIAPAIAGRGAGEVVLVDSVGTWITNLMHGRADMEAAFAATLEAAAAAGGARVFVSEEAGLGIVPGNAMAREFGDHIGDFNQRLAALADRVVLVVAGIPLTVKG